MQKRVTNANYYIFHPISKKRNTCFFKTNSVSGKNRNSVRFFGLPNSSTHYPPPLFPPPSFLLPPLSSLLSTPTTLLPPPLSSLLPPPSSLLPLRAVDMGGFGAPSQSGIFFFFSGIFTCFLAISPCFFWRGGIYPLFFGTFP